MHVMNASENNDSEEARDTMLLFGGVSLMLLGAGLVLTSPLVRKYLGGINVGKLLQTAAPDLERYLKLKSM